MLENLQSISQKRIQDIVKHLRSNFLQKLLTGKSHELFSQKAPS